MEHSIRNYNEKTLKGYCLTCMKMVDINIYGSRAYCVLDWKISIITAPLIAPEPESEIIEEPEIIEIEEIIEFEKTVEIKKTKKTYKVKSHHGLKKKEADRLKNDAACAICDKMPSEVVLAIDHCHESMAIRGVLCRNCNSGIGMLKDSLELLRRAVTYLESDPIYESADAARLHLNGNQ